MNINWVNRNATCLLGTLDTIIALLSICLAPLLLHSDYSVTKRASDDQGLGSLDDTIFCCKPLQTKKLTRLRSKLLDGKFFCFHELLCAGKQVTRKLSIVIFIIVSVHCTCAKNM